MTGFDVFLRISVEDCADEDETDERKLLRSVDGKVEADGEGRVCEEGASVVMGLDRRPKSWFMRGDGEVSIVGVEV